MNDYKSEPIEATLSVRGGIPMITFPKFDSTIDDHKTAMSLGMWLMKASVAMEVIIDEKQKTKR
jgi:hypothetical protein